MVTSAVEQARPSIEARRHSLRLNLGAENAMVSGDQTRLIQVIVNLLTNAAKYTPHGGQIVLDLSVQGCEVRLCVSDNGSGIEPSLLPHIFDLFTQGERTPDRAQGGLGLGLALVKSMVGLHGGRVQAESGGPGKGSAFSIFLPLVAGPEITLPSDSMALPLSPPAPQSRPLELVIVDDNADAAESLAALLSTAGHDVTVLENGLSTLQYAAEHAPQVFILDIGLPDMDGYQLARRLKAQPATANAVFIALTGYGQAHDKVLAKAAGFDHYFVKPVEWQALLQALTPEA
ncbi:MAG: response regulator [Massilia sp.]|nr:response regulator [Massilia sp.]